LPDRICRTGPAGRLAAAIAGESWPTPVILRAARLVVTLLFGLAGVLAVLETAQRAADIDDIATRVEPLSADTATIYRALADADAAMINGFAGSVDDPAALRERVDDDLVVATDGLMRAAERAQDRPSADEIARLGRRLPAYAGLVELARASRGDPAAEETALRRASGLMQTELLPVAESLLQRQAQLAAAHRGTTTFPVALLVVVLVLSAALLALQVWLAHRFRRGLNLGMVIATGALVLGVLWWSVTTIVSGNHIAVAQDHGRMVRDGLVPAGIAALQARTAEGLDLMTPDGGRHEHEFDERMRRLGPDGTSGALGTAARLAGDPSARARVQVAITAAADYGAAHMGQRQAAQADAFGRLDASLAIAVDAERAAFAEQTARAKAWSHGGRPVVLTLALLGIAAAAAGLTARLREYP
jgi:hypothetical protein